MDHPGKQPRGHDASHGRRMGDGGEDIAAEDLLSPTESRVLDLLERNATEQAIACIMLRSPLAIHDHIVAIYRKRLYA